jgi:hypothetical protein
MPNTSYIQLEENHNLCVPLLPGMWSLRILFQLCLLVIQRLALTISPLKVHLLMTRKHVMKAIGVVVMASLIVDTLFAVFVTTTLDCCCWEVT